MHSLQLHPIGKIHTPYKEKFAVPRQAKLVPSCVGRLELFSPYNVPEAVRGLQDFSHLWLLFHFDQIPQGKWQPTVRPPRLGGNQRLGVFASRSTHRPNPIGLSKVKLDEIIIEKGAVSLMLSEIDLVDQTPILDIKPYIAFADSEPDAYSAFAQELPVTLPVIWHPVALEKAKQHAGKLPQIFTFIEEVMRQDPRPAYQKHQQHGRIYGVKLYDFNLLWQVVLNENNEEILEILDLQA